MVAPCVQPATSLSLSSYLVFDLSYRTIRLRSIDVVQPGCRSWNRPGRENVDVFRRSVSHKARPLPIFRSFDKPGTKWIRFDVATDVEKVSVRQDGGILEPALIDVPATRGAVPTLDIAKMRIHRDLHVRGNFHPLDWPQYQVEVIRHQAKRKEPYYRSIRGIRQRREKS